MVLPVVVSLGAIVTTKTDKEEVDRLTMLTCDDLKLAVKEFLYAESVIRGREN